jgi:hypothetical protein
MPRCNWRTYNPACTKPNQKQPACLKRGTVNDVQDETSLVRPEPRTRNVRTTDHKLYENNYGGAVKRLNLIEEKLAGLEHAVASILPRAPRCLRDIAA